MENPKIYSAEKIGAPIDPESTEKKEVFKATLGFDFVFNTKNGEKTAFCVEINGENTGISGIQNIPDKQIDSTRKISAGVRSTPDKELISEHIIAKNIAADIHTGDLDCSDKARQGISQYIQKSIGKEKFFKHSNKNPDLIESITYDKKLQSEFIPKENRIPTYEDGKPIKSSTGYWISKPKNGVCGDGIKVISNKKLEGLVKELGREFTERFLIQEFIPPTGADLAPTNVSGHAASLRLLMDFRYLDDDSIYIEYETAYQRIARDPIFNDKLENNPDSSLIVNKATGALSYNASKEEFNLAHQAAMKIIQNLAKKYQKQL